MIKSTVQVSRSYRRPEYLKSSQNPEDGSKIDRHFLCPVRRCSRLRYRGKGIDTDILAAVMKCLPGPVSEQEEGLSNITEDREQQAGREGQEYRKINVSELMALYDAEKLFVGIKE